jgi:hypothetical protein
VSVANLQAKLDARTPFVASSNVPWVFLDLERSYSVPPPRLFLPFTSPTRFLALFPRTAMRTFSTFFIEGLNFVVCVAYHSLWTASQSSLKFFRSDPPSILCAHLAVPKLLKTEELSWKLSSRIDLWSWAMECSVLDQLPVIARLLTDNWLWSCLAHPTWTCYQARAKMQTSLASYWSGQLKSAGWVYLHAFNAEAAFQTSWIGFASDLQLAF